MTRPAATKRRSLGIALSWLLLAGCAEGKVISEGAAVARSDSAGIQIVETSRAAWAAGGGWTLDQAPDLVIGRMEGEAPYLFGDVRGAVRLENGSIVVVDNQARELRWFDRGGAFIRSAGRPGEGPEEFRTSAWSLERCGEDRLYVHDLWAQRMVSWDTTGAFQRGFNLTEPGQPARGVYEHACRDDGGFVAVGWGDSSTMPRLPDGSDPIFYRQYAPVWALDSTGALESEYGRFLSSERIAHPRGSGPHPFGRAVKFAAGGGRVFIGTGEGFSIGVYRDDRLIEIWRASADDLAIEEGFLEAFSAVEVDQGHERERNWVTDGLVEMPPALPGFTELRVSPDGHLWAKRFGLPWEETNRWGIFAPDGTFLGNLDLPAGLSVTEIGNDYVLGVAANELEVQRVELHMLRQ
jgi:hypothetical protein